MYYTVIVGGLRVAEFAELADAVAFIKTKRDGGLTDLIIRDQSGFELRAVS